MTRLIWLAIAAVLVWTSVLDVRIALAAGRHGELLAAGTWALGAGWMVFCAVIVLGPATRGLRAALKDVSIVFLGYTGGGR